LHYCEPRILSVRECARLQSFPDWFVFKGKYTTGGQLRRRECPRYTQVGNAVPPLLARAIAAGVASMLHSAGKRPTRRGRGVNAEASAVGVG
jgi:DNA (cytosine-5)-methyltransferase 1